MSRSSIRNRRCANHAQCGKWAVMFADNKCYCGVCAAKLIADLQQQNNDLKGDVMRLRQPATAPCAPAQVDAITPRADKHIDAVVIDYNKPVIG